MKEGWPVMMIERLLPMQWIVRAAQAGLVEAVEDIDNTGEIHAAEYNWFMNLAKDRDGEVRLAA